jgi:lipoyl(octanoyl) transferase
LEADASREPTIDHAFNATARNFGRVFQRQMLWCESIEQLLAPAGAAR